MNDIIDDLKALVKMHAGNSYILMIFDRCIQEIESLRQLLGITEDIEPIGAAPRSPHWDKVRDAVVKERGECEACGCRVALEAHHIEPFHEKPELELDPANLIVLDRVCHFLLGHLRSWRSVNVGVREDARRLREKVRSRP